MYLYRTEAPLTCHCYGWPYFMEKLMQIVDDAVLLDTLWIYFFMADLMSISGVITYTNYRVLINTVQTFLKNSSCFSFYTNDCNL